MKIDGRRRELTQEKAARIRFLASYNRDGCSQDCLRHDDHEHMTRTQIARLVGVRDSVVSRVIREGR